MTDSYNERIAALETAAQQQSASKSTDQDVTESRNTEKSEIMSQPEEGGSTDKDFGRESRMVSNSTIRNS
jgi:hypothetical protein